MFGPTDYTTIIGLKGHGKTTLCRKIQGFYPRIVVIDRMREYERPSPMPFNEAWVTGLDQFARALEYSMQFERFRIVYQFDIEATNKDMAFNRALELAYRRGSVCLVIEEIWAFAKPTWLPHWLEEICFTGRHRGLAMIATCQRPGRINKTILSQSAHKFLGRITEKNDLNYLAEEIGEDTAKLPTLPPYRFLWKRSGHDSQVVPNE